SIATDANGNVFVTGLTNSTNFPTYDPGGGAYYQGTNAGNTDIFILKFTNSGVRLWATYYGGNDYDRSYSITTDTSGNVFVTGLTYSTNFPTYDPGGGAYYQGSNAGGSDVFILKFTNSGVRLWATYYGGSGSDVGFSITPDANGNVFITGYTNSTNFPTYDPGGGAYYQGSNAGGIDIFILKFTNSGQRLWATYYGGSGDERNWNCSITIDANGNIFVTGYTTSTNFPTYDPGGGAYYQGSNAGYDDAFILKFSNSGQRSWATYYGGSSSDGGYSIKTDASGNVFVTGGTWSTDFPTYNPGGGAYYQGTYTGSEDIFILKFETSLVGVKENESHPDVVIASTPSFFNSQIVLRFSSSSKSPLKIVIHNISGIPVYENSFPFTPSIITLSDKKIIKIKKGVYFLSVYSDNKKIAEIKLIKG
ncbi:MAG: SBBP repeat-containing protein, partial [candidate division WOR-3 bacterium]